MMDEEEVEEEETENHLPPLLTHDEERKEGNSSTFGPLWGRRKCSQELSMHGWRGKKREGEKKKQRAGANQATASLGTVHSSSPRTSIRTCSHRTALPASPGAHLAQLRECRHLPSSRHPSCNSRGITKTAYFRKIISMATERTNCFKPTN